MSSETSTGVLTTVTPPKCRWQQRRKGLLVLSAIVLLMVLARGPLLYMVALPLVHADGPISATGILLLGGDTRLDETTQFHQKNPDGDVLLLQPAPGRLVRMQILTSPEDLARNDLVERGVSVSKISVVNWASFDEAMETALGRWLNDHPDVKLVVVCDAFESRGVRWRLDRQLPRQTAARLAVRPLVSQSFRQSDWWHSKRGIMALLRSWTGLVMHVVDRGTERRWRECDPEQFRPAVQ